MKFGKEFAAQMVQEWQGAYMDYNYLKSILKHVLLFKQRNTTPSPMAAATSQGALKRRLSLYRAFSGLTSRHKGSPKKNNEEEVILVSALEEDGEGGGGEGGWGYYETMFLNASEAGGEYEMVFFKRLDDELNKVIKFYKKKVEEVMVEAEDLSKQMDALVALRIKVENPVLGGAEVVNLASHGFASVLASAAHHPNSGRNPG